MRNLYQAFENDKMEIQQIEIYLDQLTYETSVINENGEESPKHSTKFNNVSELENEYRKWVSDKLLNGFVLSNIHPYDLDLDSEEYIDSKYFVASNKYTVDQVESRYNHTLPSYLKSFLIDKKYLEYENKKTHKISWVEKAPITFFGKKLLTLFNDISVTGPLDDNLVPFASIDRGEYRGVILLNVKRRSIHVFDPDSNFEEIAIGLEEFLEKYIEK